MDIVSCRNLLIYLKPRAHDRLLERLHFALRTAGILVLGRAESLSHQTRLFEEVSKGKGIYRSRSVPRRERFQVTPRRTERTRGGEPPLPSPPPATRLREPSPERRIEQLVLREVTPACVVVNADLAIRHFYGQTDRYLVPPTGESRQDLLAWVRPGFHVRLGSAVREAATRGESLVVEGQVDRDGDVQRVECTIQPLPSRVDAESLFLVTFRDSGPSALRKRDPTQSHEPLVRELEQELIDTRRELQSAIEQLEMGDEEHRAAQEETWSINEELQSSNEELEASKEELEALNEEMNTINRELEEKNSDLRTAHNDLSNLFMSTHIPTVFLDRDLRIRSFTPATTSVLRLVPADIGRSIDHIKERFAEGRTAERARDVLTTLEPAADELHSDDDCWYMRSILPYRTDDEGVDGVCITFTEVTAQKHLARSSQAARAYAEDVIATVRTPLLVLDESLRVVSFNRSFTATLGTRDLARGQHVAETGGARWNVEGLIERLNDVVATGTELNDFEVSAGGRTIVVNGRRLERGPEEGRIVLSFEDLTEQRQIQNAVEGRAQELERDARRKDEWIAMLGHELRNPVGAIANGTELLRSATLPASAAEVVGMIERQGRHLRRLLDDLLDAARIASGRFEIERASVDLAAAARVAIEGARAVLQEAGIEFSTSLAPEGSLVVRGDAARLTQLVANLLVNAARYTRRGGRVRLEVVREGEDAIVRVADTGIGISSELMPHIFETFSQGPRISDHAGQGLGLGLSIVREIARLHGGEVEVSSDGEDQGSEFKVTLPRSDDVVAGSQARADLADDRRSNPPLRILVVDDQADAAESLRAVLAMRGHDVRTAADGPGGLETAQAFGPCVALVDLGLPGMDGYALARKLRQLFPEALLVAVTGYQPDEARLEKAGFDHQLTKPVDLAALDGLLATTHP